MHVLIRADLDRLGVTVVVNDPTVSGYPVVGDENIQKCVGDTVLKFIEPEVFSFTPDLFKIGGVENDRQLGAPLIDILVFQLLGIGQNIHLAEDGVGRGDIIIGTPGDDGAPTAAGNIGEADMIPGAETAEEKGNAERERFRKVCGEFPTEQPEVPRVKPESQRLFFIHKKVGFEGVRYQQQAAAVDSPPDIVQPAMAGVVTLYGIMNLGQSGRIQFIPLDLVRIETQSEQTDQELRHFGMIIKRTLNILQPEPLRLAVSQAGMAERDEGVDECSIFTGEKPFDNIVPIRR